MLELVNLLWDLVLDNVLIGVIRDGVNGVMVVLEYQTPTGVTFKRAKITTANPGYVMSYERLIDGDWASQGHHHITRTGHLAETVWREFGGNVADLIRFCDENPAYKAEMLGQ